MNPGVRVLFHLPNASLPVLFFSLIRLLYHYFLAEDWHEQEDEPFYPKDSGSKKKMAPKLRLARDIVNNLKYPIGKELRLIGFKPASWLKNNWQIKEALWVYPGMNASINPSVLLDKTT